MPESSAMISGFTFDESTHTYSVHGLIVPGVTRCLDHSGLVSFEYVRRDILERKSALGRAVHLATQLDDGGKLDLDSIDVETRFYLESWRGFRKATKFTPRLREHRMIGELDGMACGMQIDAEGLFMGAEAILDLKISEFEEWHGIQLAGYAAMLPCDGLKTSTARFLRRRRFGVKLFADGKPGKVREYKNPRDLSIFSAALLITTTKMIWGKRIDDGEK